MVETHQQSVQRGEKTEFPRLVAMISPLVICYIAGKLHIYSWFTELKDGDFPSLFVCLPEGTWGSGGKSRNFLRLTRTDVFWCHEIHGFITDGNPGLSCHKSPGAAYFWTPHIHFRGSGYCTWLVSKKNGPWPKNKRFNLCVWWISTPSTSSCINPYNVGKTMS